MVQKRREIFWSVTVRERSAQIVSCGGAPFRHLQHAKRNRVLSVGPQPQLSPKTFVHDIRDGNVYFRRSMTSMVSRYASSRRSDKKSGLQRSEDCRIAPCP